MSFKKILSYFKHKSQNGEIQSLGIDGETVVNFVKCFKCNDYDIDYYDIDKCPSINRCDLCKKSFCKDCSKKYCKWYESDEMYMCDNCLTKRKIEDNKKTLPSKTSFQIKDLIFSNNGGYREDDKLLYGTVMCFEADRCPKNDIFIVINHDNNILRCIFPRMRIIDNKIILGQDKLSNNIKKINYSDIRKKYNIDGCKCTNDFLNVTTCDICFEKMKLYNSETFNAQDENYEYEIYNLQLPNPYIEYITKNEINKNDNSCLSYIKT
jgi:hypothetical protein